MSPLGGAMIELRRFEAQTYTPEAKAWYVVQTKRHRDYVAQRFLAERGVGSYLPRVVQWPRPVVGSGVGPMFPGYLFVRASLPDEFYRITWTPGVKAFVTFGEAPAVVDPQVIDFLRRRESTDGVIRCNQGVTENSEVEIIHGPLRGLTAIVEQRLPARERVRVLIHMLQRQTPLELPERWVRQS